MVLVIVEMKKAKKRSSKARAFEGGFHQTFIEGYTSRFGRLYF